VNPLSVKAFLDGLPRIDADNEVQHEYEMGRLAGLGEEEAAVVARGSVALRRGRSNVVGRSFGGKWLSFGPRGEADRRRLEEMLETRKGPSVRTDSTFLAGHCNGSQFEATPWVGDFYRGVAEKAGVNTVGKVYKAGLASYPGDPTAWVSGRGDVERVAREKGMRVEGDVNCDYTKAGPWEEPPPDVDVAPDVVEQRVMQMVAENPDIEHTRKAEDVYAEAHESLLPSAAA
jgi:hypothetical protein